VVLFRGCGMMPRGEACFQQDFPNTIKPVFPYSTGYVLYYPPSSNF
jgi:hypothetical protein